MILFLYNIKEKLTLFASLYISVINFLNFDERECFMFTFYISIKEKGDIILKKIISVYI